MDLKITEIMVAQCQKQIKFKRSSEKITARGGLLIFVQLFERFGLK